MRLSSCHVWMIPPEKKRISIRIPENGWWILEDRQRAALMLVSINSSNGIFNVSSVESCEISGFTLGEIDLFFLFLPVSYSVGRRMILSIFGRLFLIEKSGWEPQRVAQRLTDLLTCNFSTTFPKFGFKIKHKKEKVKRLKKKKKMKRYKEIDWWLLFWKWPWLLRHPHPH